MSARRKRALSDAAQIRGIIDQELRDDLAEELEDQILNGNGVGENFTGMLQHGGRADAGVRHGHPDDDAASDDDAAGDRARSPDRLGAQPGGLGDDRAAPGLRTIATTGAGRWRRAALSCGGSRW